MKKQDVVVFGVGKNYEMRYKYIYEKYDIVALSDNDSSKWHKTDSLSGKTIIPPSEIKSMGAVRILVTPSLFHETMSQLQTQLDISSIEVLVPADEQMNDIFKSYKGSELSSLIEETAANLCVYSGYKPKAPYVCTSQLCNMEFLTLPLVQYWANLLKEPVVVHRKHWEYVFIAQVLYENGMLKTGKRGLGFACGKEPLPALFASMGCEVLATDLDVNDARAAGWARSNQNTMNTAENLNERGICSPERFAEFVTFQPVDMNEIPVELYGKFDFNWSSCAAEHIGGMKKSMNFLQENLKSLKNGGIAVHTFEFNLSSNDNTVFDPNCFVFRKRDVESVAETLREEGHEVYPLNFKVGPYAADRFIDTFPYNNRTHLRLLFDKFTITSFGLIVRKN